MRVRVFIAVATCLFVAAPLLAQGPPEFSGPIVVRGEVDGADYDFWYGYVDWKRGYVAFHGVDIVSWCEWEPGDPDPVGYNIWSFMNVFPPTPDDGGVIHRVLKAEDSATSVWPISILDNGFNWWEWCPLLLEETPLATGTVDIVETDNDLNANSGDHNRKNAYKISAHGVLVAPDGEPMMFNGGFHCVWSGFFADDGFCKEKIVLH